jgi:hypothetical protein
LRHWLHSSQEVPKTAGRASWPLPSFPSKVQHKAPLGRKQPSVISPETRIPFSPKCVEGKFCEVQLHVGGYPAPLSWIETFVTLCGMVGVQAMVLGRGSVHVSQPRACALSCPLPAIYGPGALGHLTRPQFVCIVGVALCVCVLGLYNPLGRAGTPTLARPSLPLRCALSRCHKPSSVPRSTTAAHNIDDDTSIPLLEHLVLWGWGYGDFHAGVDFRFTQF